MVNLIFLGLVLTIDAFAGTIVSATSPLNVTTTPKAESSRNLSVPTIAPTVTLDKHHHFRFKNTTYTPTSEDLQRTQLIAVIGFSAVVLMAIFAWLFSKHYCCFIEKPAINPGRQMPSQFNFLGARVIRRLSTTTTVQPPKREEPPPSYDELFPPNPSTPAPAYTEVEIVDINATQSSPSTSTEEPKDKQKDPEINNASPPTV